MAGLDPATHAVPSASSVNITGFSRQNPEDNQFASTNALIRGKISPRHFRPLKIP